ncbi:MAG: Ldh family oxidoreductase [Candidatus Zixiibacteriota bacterium]
MADTYVDDVKLTKFCTEVFVRLGVPRKDAQVTSDVLVASDLRGIPSHGVARLMRYVDGIRKGTILPKVKPKIIKETYTTAAIDAKHGLGQPASYFGMNLAIKKAKRSGVGFVTVRNSNHYGIAGYYSMMALKNNLIGISMTNSAPLAVPTFGRASMIGTNPISVVAPASKTRPYVLDMATTVVPRGKLEVLNRLGKPLPLGWAVDEKGVTTTDTGRVLENMDKAAGGGVLPLGGAGEDLSGHKGYGLSLMVDMFSGALSGADFGPWVKTVKMDGSKGFINVGHFFGAIKIDNFIPLRRFKTTMDEMLEGLKSSNKAKGEKRIFIHGEKEFEKFDTYKKKGVPLQEKVVAALKGLSKELGIPYNIKK